jgi:septin family protein
LNSPSAGSASSNSTTINERTTNITTICKDQKMPVEKGSNVQVLLTVVDTPGWGDTSDPHQAQVKNIF